MSFSTRNLCLKILGFSLHFVCTEAVREDDFTLEKRKPNLAARRLLRDGRLLSSIEAVALKLSNNYDFARRIVQEVSLQVAGQIIRYFKVDQLDRAYSHAGLYAPPGLGKDYAWKLVRASGIFPTDKIRMTKLENITEAVLVGTVTESTIIPPPAVTEDVIFVGEFATLMRGISAASIAADMRAMLESGEYSRRLAKIGVLKEILMTQPHSHRAKYIQDQLGEYERIGMTLDLDKSQIHVKTTTSWMISSARFGSETTYGRSLLSMGDVNRYRWRSYLPDRKERIRITSEVGSLPPIQIEGAERKVCREALDTLVSSTKSLLTNGLPISRDEQSYHERQKIWDATQKAVADTYEKVMTKVHFNQLVNLRTRAEFTRLIHQHAVFKQFERDQGHDFAQPSKFIVNYSEDGEFAKQLWVNDYVPSMIDVINDILRHSRARSKWGKKSARGVSTAKGEEIVVERLKEGPAKRAELKRLVEKAGISSSTLDNQILPSLLRDGVIKKGRFGWYFLVKERK